MRLRIALLSAFIVRACSGLRLNGLVHVANPGRSWSLRDEKMRQACVPDAESLAEGPSENQGAADVLSARVWDPSNKDGRFLALAKAKLGDEEERVDVRQLQMLSFYCFTPVADPTATRDRIFSLLTDLDPQIAEAKKDPAGEPRAEHDRPFLAKDAFRGTVYVAEEGINGQLAVPVGKVEELRQRLLQVPELAPEGRLSLNIGDVVDAETSTFRRFLVRRRKQILTDHLEGDDALNLADAGEELKAAEWHEAMRAEDAIVLDCRNDYESSVGKFKPAVPLDTRTFGDTWAALEARLPEKAREQPDTPVYIYCTGGIRCVKVGAYMKQKLGLKNVKRLEHGIIGYERWAEAEDVDSTFEGENFFFDRRAVVDPTSESKAEKRERAPGRDDTADHDVEKRSRIDEADPQ